MRPPLRLLTLFLLAGCTTAKFQPISPHQVTRGSGGSTTVVAGIPFWQEGTPDRKYEILGYADDFWRGPSFDRHDYKMLARVVKASGGDAGVVIRGDKPAPGLKREPDEVGDTVLRLQIIKYR